MKMLIRFVIAGFPLILLNTVGFSQEFRDWDNHDVVRFYEKIDLNDYSLDEDGEEIDEIYQTTTIKSGLYEVEVYKISSNLYQVRGSNIYMYFRYSPYMYNYDEGILEVSYSSGTFYEKP